MGIGSPPLAGYDPEYQYEYLPNQHRYWLGNQIDCESDGLRSDRKQAVVTDYPPRVLFVGGSVTNGGLLTSHLNRMPAVAGGGERKEEARRVCLQTLGRMIQRGREQGCTVLVVLTPDGAELMDPPRYAQEMRGGGGGFGGEQVARGPAERDAE